MAKFISAQRLSGKKQARRYNEKCRVVAFRRSKKPLIPDSILKALSASELPPTKRAYTKRLKELLK
jgi:hypothetical protein